MKIQSRTIVDGNYEKRVLTCVVYDDIQAIFLLLDSLCSLLDALQVGHIERKEDQIRFFARILAIDLADSILRLFFTPRC